MANAAAAAAGVLHLWHGGAAKAGPTGGWLGQRQTQKSETFMFLLHCLVHSTMAWDSSQLAGEDLAAGMTLNPVQSYHAMEMYKCNRWMCCRPSRGRRAYESLTSNHVLIDSEVRCPNPLTCVHRSRLNGKPCHGCQSDTAC